MYVFVMVSVLHEALTFEKVSNKKLYL